MAPWTCPRCDRQFGRRNQSHSCAPALAMILSRRLSHPRIVRALGISGRRIAYFIPLESARDVDDMLREWLTVAYLESPM